MKTLKQATLPSYNEEMVPENPLRNGMMFSTMSANRELKKRSVVPRKACIAMQPLIHDIVFTRTDHNTVSWSSGTIYLGDNTSIAIDSGNSGNLTNDSGIFYETSYGSVLQVDDIGNGCVSENRILLAIAKPETSPTLITVVAPYAEIV